MALITKVEIDRNSKPVRVYHRTDTGRYAWTHPVTKDCQPDPNHCVVGKEEK